MASQLNSVVEDNRTELAEIFGSLDRALGLLDQLGLSEAAARLSTVLDVLVPFINDANESFLATES